MRRRLIPLILVSGIPAWSVPVEEPRAEKIPHVTQIHGNKMSDDYFWIREKSNPKVMELLKAENRYTEDQMKSTLPLQEKLYQEMVGRIQEDDSQPPLRQGQYFSYSRTEKGKQYPIYWEGVKFAAKVRALKTNQNQVLVKVNLAAGHGGASGRYFRLHETAFDYAYILDKLGR